MEVVEKQLYDLFVISMRGQILLCTENECRKYFEKIADEKSNKTVILDMSGVGYINNAGVNMIVKCIKKFRENGGRLVFCGLTQEVGNLFDIINLTRLIEVYPDEETALKNII